jgi:acetylornithine deacetylase/succinyl-diaminopimelate desuccinylase-like protein
VSALDIDKATREALAYLQRLVRFDTTNPPGNELPCAKWIAEVFEKEGLQATVLEPAPGRGSVVARIPGKGGKKPLLLLSHLDVVPAKAEDWEHDPFGAEIVDGEVWGRGTLDTKNLTATWMVLFLSVKRLGLSLDRDLIFAATADEEMGGTWGVQWLLENRPELVDCEYVLNEGGGMAFELGGRTFFTYQTAEKGICWVKLTAHGTAGHASIPHADNPVVHLAEAVRRLGTTRLPVHVSESFRLFVERLAAGLPEELGRVVRMVLDEETAETALAALKDESQADRLRAMSRNTASPTRLEASDKVNVIPQKAVAEVDCRILPGQTPEDLLRELRQVLGLEGTPDEKIQVEFTRTSPPTESPPDTELSRAIERVLARHAPDACLVPFLVPGGTDSRFFRPRGVVAYGFSPTLSEADVRTVHGKNERLPIRSLEFSVKVLWDVILDIAR